MPDSRPCTRCHAVSSACESMADLTRVTSLVKVGRCARSMWKHAFAIW